jgi:hypothetical protein
MAQESLGEEATSKRAKVDTHVWASSAPLESRLEANRTCAIASDPGTGDCALPRLSGRCARFVKDNAVPEEKALILRQMVQWLIDEAWGAGSGPPSVVDLHAGSISYKENFVDLYAFMDFKKIEFTEEQVQTYNEVRRIVRKLVSDFFGVPEEALQHDLTFFSHINGSKVAKTLHDEYWHTHIDTEQYGTFAYTSLLYLGTANEDFQGGAFVFEDKPSHNAVEPRFNRLVSFTSDAENTHYADKVTSGVRIALTAAFTCNIDKANSIAPFPRRAEVTENAEVERS